MPRIRAGILKDKNGKWRISTNFSYRGNVKSIDVRGFNTEREAYAEKVRLHKLFKEGFYSTGAPLHFTQLAIMFFEDYKTTVKETTAANRFSSFKKYFIDPYEDKTLNQVIDPGEIKKFKASLILNNISSDWTNKLLKYYSQIIEFAYQRGWIDAITFNTCNLELKLVYVDHKAQNDITTWSKTEFKTFIETFQPTDRYFILFHVLAHTGVRISELRGLRVKHFDREARTISIETQITSKVNGGWKETSLKTSSSRRIIELSSEISNLLVDYIDSLEIKHDQFIFHSFSPDNPIGEQTVRTTLDRHIKQAKVKRITLHGFRHSNTTWILSGNLTPQEILQVSRRLGHKDKNVTFNIYFHIHEKKSENILKNLEF